MKNRKLQNIKYRWNLRKNIQQLSQELLIITKEEVNKELERRKNER